MLLFRRIIQLVTRPEDVVLDMFMGSGTTGKAALLENRRFIGIEREEGYFDFTRNRLAGLMDKEAA